MENTTKERIGDTLRVIIGTDDYKKDITIDLNDSNYMGTKATVITLPAEVITKSNQGNIELVGRDYMLKFSPRVFDITKVRQHKDRSDAGVRFEIALNDGNQDGNGMTALSTQYILGAEFYVGKEISSMDYLNNYMEFSLNYDSES